METLSGWHLAAQCLLGVLVLGLLYIGLWHDRSRGRPRCPKCWYDLRNLVGNPCPECGHQPTRPQHYFQTRRRWSLVLLAVVLSLAAAYAPQVHRRITLGKEPWWRALEPTTLLLLRSPLHAQRANSRQLPADDYAPQQRFFDEGSAFRNWQLWLLTHSVRWRAPHGDLLAGTAVLNFLRAHADKPAAAAAILRLQNHPDPKVRARGAALLNSFWHDERTAPALLHYLQDSTTLVQHAALYPVQTAPDLALTTLSDANLLQMLRCILQMPRVPHVQSDREPILRDRQGKTQPIIPDMRRAFAGDRVLCEVQRRGRRELAPALLDLLDPHMTPRSDPVLELEILTTARRLRGEPDPLQIEISTTRIVWAGEPAPWSTMTRVTLTNRDIENRAITVCAGYDDPLRWRLDQTQGLLINDFRRLIMPDSTPHWPAEEVVLARPGSALSLMVDVQQIIKHTLPHPPGAVTITTALLYHNSVSAYQGRQSQTLFPTSAVQLQFLGPGDAPIEPP